METIRLKVNDAKKQFLEHQYAVARWDIGRGQKFKAMWVIAFTAAFFAAIVRLAPGHTGTEYVLYTIAFGFIFNGILFWILALNNKKNYLCVKIVSGIWNHKNEAISISNEKIEYTYKSKAAGKLKNISYRGKFTKRRKCREAAGDTVKYSIPADKIDSVEVQTIRSRLEVAGIRIYGMISVDIFDETGKKKYSDTRNGCFSICDYFRLDTAQGEEDSRSDMARNAGRFRMDDYFEPGLTEYDESFDHFEPRFVKWTGNRAIRVEHLAPIEFEY